MLGRGLQDIEFWQSKVKILSEEISILSGEVFTLRKKLRDAEDNRIKYELFIKNNQMEINKQKASLQKMKISLRQQIQGTLLAQNDQKWKTLNAELQQNLRKEATQTIETLRLELSQAKQIIKQFQSKRQDMELYGFKMKRYEKQNQLLQERIQEMKIFYESKKQQEITTLKNHLTTFYKQKIANQRNNYENKISNLEKRVQQLQIQKDDSQFKIPNMQIDTFAQLKASVQEKNKLYEQQLEELRESIFKKNQEIHNLLTEKKKSQQSYRAQIADKNNFIEELQTRLMERERQFSNELFSAIQRNNFVKENQQIQLKNQIKTLKEEIERQNGLWHQKIINQEGQIQALNKKHQEERKRFNQQKNQHKKRISDLSVKLKEVEGDRQFGDTQMLINSLKDIDAKDQMIGGYENGIVFLQRQLKKCQIKLMERSRTVDKLYKDINEFRAEADKQLNEVKQKSKRQKKELYDKILALQKENKQLHDKIRLINRQERKRQRETFKQKTQLQEKIAAQNQLIQQLQRDYNRVIEGKKGIENSYRQQKQRNITNVSEATLLRKQKWMDLQKQKNDLEIIFRDKFEQEKIKFQGQIDQKNHIIDQLRQNLQLTKKENELLREENKKVLSQIESNKENNRLSEYNKKIASLNLQIALTQNIYETISKIKGKKLTESQIFVHSEEEQNQKQPSFQEERSAMSMSFARSHITAKK